MDHVIVTYCYEDPIKNLKIKPRVNHSMSFFKCYAISPSIPNVLMTRIIFRRLFPGWTSYTTVSVWVSASTLCVLSKVAYWTFATLSPGPATSSQFCTSLCTVAEIFFFTPGNTFEVFFSASISTSLSRSSPMSSISSTSTFLYKDFSLFIGCFKQTYCNIPLKMCISIFQDTEEISNWMNCYQLFNNRSKS